MSISAKNDFHHRSTIKADHKPFKSKHATKSALKDRAKGKVEREDRGKRRTPHQQVLSKLDRRNKAKQLRINHKEKQDHEANIFQGVDGASKHVAVVPLSNSTDVSDAITRLNHSVEAETGIPIPARSPILVQIERFKRKLSYLPVSANLLEAIDVCKLADWVVILVSAEQIFGEKEDEFLRAMEGQGITNIAVAVTDLEAKLPANKRSKHLTELKKAFRTWFPDLDKICTLENKSDCANLARSLCMASTKGIRWRDDRSWMLVDDVRWQADAEKPDSQVPVLVGTVRGRCLNADRLVHVPSWGEYRIKRITEVRTQVHKRKATEMATEDDIRHWQPTVDQDDLADLAPERMTITDEHASTTTIERKGVLLDDHHYFSDDDSHVLSKPRKLPKGVSNYQAAWFLDDVSDSDSDVMDEDVQDINLAMDGMELRPEDGSFPDKTDAMTDVAETEYPESEMHIDADEAEEARQLEAHRASRKKQAEEDLEFPDEIELHPDVLARERLAKYRGLKSLRTSEWNTEEDKAHEPADFSRLLQIPEYRKSYSAAVKESLVGGVPTGTRVEVELEGVPAECQHKPTPQAMFGLLRHEHKQAVINIHLTLSSSLAEPIKSKEELVIQIGHRRLLINPIFSAAGQTPNDVHKFDRFLHPGRNAIATFTGPLTWGAVPVLVFRRRRSPPSQSLDDGAGPEIAPPLSDLELIGTATTLPPSSSRIIAKRIILTGHPYKIHKKLVTIRYMFFNRGDVEWFQALPLWTKRGRQGWIKEPLGTHGYFKATFDGAGKVNAMDAIGVSLYKRVWPRASTQLE